MSGRDIEVAPGLTKENFARRLALGWTVERAMTTPVRPRGVPAIERFRAKCKPLENGCVEWTAAKDDKGYGRFCDENGQMQLAHRWVFQHEHKVVLPVELDVCHSCDWPPCVCLGHLFSGTRQENVDDCVRKGRTSHDPRSHGVEHWKARLNDQLVVEIRQHRAAGRTLKSIAEQYGVSIQNIWQISTRNLWKHVP